MPLSRPINFALLKEALDKLGLALINHNHQWTHTERSLWDRASTAVEGRAINLPLFKDAIEVVGLALATHHHDWTDTERKLWERAWAEIRWHQNKQGEDTTNLRTVQGTNVRRQAV